MIHGANEWIQEIHRNAVAHGWWEQDRSMEEVLALIHSEWSEALEEDRAGRPFIWFDTVENGDDCGGGGRCNAEVIFGMCCGKNGSCPCGHKPEGIAVELIDGCIRIMDWLGKCGHAVPMGSIQHIGEIGVAEFEWLIDAPVSRLIAHLHHVTSYALLLDEKRFILEQNRRDKASAMYLLQVLEIVFGWLVKRGYDPEVILAQKHWYNVTRPYKHGKQY